MAVVKVELHRDSRFAKNLELADQILLALSTVVAY